MKTPKLQKSLASKQSTNPRLGCNIELRWGGRRRRWFFDLDGDRLFRFLAWETGVHGDNIDRRFADLSTCPSNLASRFIEFQSLRSFSSNANLSF